MSLSDPIADMLTRIRNAARNSAKRVDCRNSKICTGIATVLKAEGYIADYSTTENGGKVDLTIELKYFEGKPVIEEIRRVSKPGLRIYRGREKLPKVQGGLGVAIVSTSAGVMSDRQARERGIGGEVICVVS